VEKINATEANRETPNAARMPQNRAGHALSNVCIALYLAELEESTVLRLDGNSYISSPSEETEISPRDNDASVVKSFRAWDKLTPARVATSDATTLSLLEATTASITALEGNFSNIFSFNDAVVGIICRGVVDVVVLPDVVRNPRNGLIGVERGERMRVDVGTVGGGIVKDGETMNASQLERIQ
jgi:hypothetical protein